MNRFADNLSDVFPTLLLWLGALFVAMMLLGRSMKRRRELLTEALKKHVVKEIGVRDETSQSETAAKP